VSHEDYSHAMGFVARMELLRPYQPSWVSQIDIVGQVWTWGESHD